MWNRSSSSMDVLITSQRSVSDKSGLRFRDPSPTPSMEKSLNIGNNKISSFNRNIVFIKSKKDIKSIISSYLVSADQVTISKDNKSHTGVGFVKLQSKFKSTNAPRRIVEFGGICSTNQPGAHRRVNYYSMKIDYLKKKSILSTRVPDEKTSSHTLTPKAYQLL